MQPHGALIRSDEAFEFVENLKDAVTRNLVNMGLVKAVSRALVLKTDVPTSDFDLLFFAHVLEDLLSEHDVIRQTLDGERVGEWFEDD